MNVMFGKDEKSNGDGEQGYRPRSREGGTPSAQNETKDGVSENINYLGKNEISSQKEGNKEGKQEGAPTSHSSAYLKDDTVSEQKAKGGNRQPSATGVPEGQTVSELSLMQSLTSQEMLTSYYTQEMTLMNSRIEYLQEKLNNANEQAAEEEDVFEGQLSKWNDFYKEKQDNLYKELTDLEEELEQVREEKEEIIEMKKDKEKEFSEYETRVEELQKNYEHYNENMETSREQIKSLEEQNKTMSSELIVQNDEIKQLEIEREEFIAKLNQYKDMENMLQRRIHKEVQTINIENVEIGTITDSIDHQFKAVQTEGDPLYEYDDTTNAEVKKIIENVYKEQDFVAEKIERELNECDEEFTQAQEDHLKTTKMLEETQLRERQYQEYTMQQIELENECAEQIEELETRQARIQEEMKKLIEVETQGVKPVAEEQPEEEDSEEDSEYESEQPQQAVEKLNALSAKKRPQPKYHEVKSEKPYQHELPRSTSNEINEILNAMSQVSGMFQGQQTRLLEVKVEPEYQKIHSLLGDSTNEAHQGNDNKLNASHRPGNHHENDTKSQKVSHNTTKASPRIEKASPFAERKEEEVEEEQKHHQEKNKKTEESHNEHQEQQQTLSKMQAQSENEITNQKSSEETKSIGLLSSGVEHKQGGALMSSTLDKERVEPPYSAAWTTEELLSARERPAASVSVIASSPAPAPASPHVLDIDKHISKDFEEETHSTSEEEEQEYTEEFKKKMEKVITRLLETGYLDDDLTKLELKYMKERGFEVDDSDSDVSLEKKFDSVSDRFKTQAKDALNKIMAGESTEITQQQAQFLGRQLCD